MENFGATVPKFPTSRDPSPLVYVVVALVMTWPLARVAPGKLAADLGDPAFNCWILAWTSGQILKALHGDFSALAQFWNGNIFHPEPYSLALSEHMFAQALQIAPVYAATGNVILAFSAK